MAKKDPEAEVVTPAETSTTPDKPEQPEQPEKPKKMIPGKKPGKPVAKPSRQKLIVLLSSLKRARSAFLDARATGLSALADNTLKRIDAEIERVRGIMPLGGK